MMKLFFREGQKKDPVESKKNPVGVTLVITGSNSDADNDKLVKDLEAKGVKAVVTKSPVLGVFDL